MTFNEYQILASRTINHDLTKIEQQYHSLHGMVGEIGELHSIYQKNYQGHKPDKEHMIKELGDLLWFMSEYALTLGVTLEDVARINIEKLEARYKGEGFTVEESLHRAKGDI